MCAIIWKRSSVAVAVMGCGEDLTMCDPGMSVVSRKMGPSIFKVATSLG